MKTHWHVVAWAVLFVGGMVTSRVHDVNALSDAQKRALSDAVWREVNRSVFTSVGASEFYEYFIGSDTPVNKVQTLHGEGGAMIGYVSFRVVNKVVAGKDYGVVRAATCMLSEYRGKSSMNGFVLREIARYIGSQTFTGRRVLFFFTANSPASFYAVARYTRRIYPDHRGETPESGRDLVKAVANAFDLTIDDQFTLTYDGLVVHEEARDALDWKRHPHSAVKFYLERCPRYRNGQALAVVVPAGSVDLVHSMARIAYDYLLKKLGVRKFVYRGQARAASAMSEAPSAR